MYLIIIHAIWIAAIIFMILAAYYRGKSSVYRQWAARDQENLEFMNDILEQAKENERIYLQIKEEEGNG